MPLYEYKCRSCGQVSEVLVQGFFSPQNPKCPGCGQEMERRLSSPSLVTEKAKMRAKPAAAARNGVRNRPAHRATTAGEHKSPEGAM